MIEACRRWEVKVERCRQEGRLAGFAIPQSQVGITEEDQQVIREAHALRVRGPFDLSDNSPAELR